MTVYGSTRYILKDSNENGKIDLNEGLKKLLDDINSVIEYAENHPDDYTESQISDLHKMYHKWSNFNGTADMTMGWLFGYTLKNVDKLKNQLTSIDSGVLSPENIREIATRLNVKEAEVISMDNRMYSGDQSLNVQITNDVETEWQDMLADEKKTQDKILEEKDEFNYRKKIFINALSVLNKREKEIITLRKLREKPLKLEELSVKYKISRERVRQIEEKALSKLQ